MLYKWPSVYLFLSLSKFPPPSAKGQPTLPKHKNSLQPGAKRPNPITSSALNPWPLLWTGQVSHLEKLPGQGCKPCRANLGWLTGWTGSEEQLLGPQKALLVWAVPTP